MVARIRPDAQQEPTFLFAPAAEPADEAEQTRRQAVFENHRRAA